MLFHELSAFDRSIETLALVPVDYQSVDTKK